MVLDTASITCAITQLCFIMERGGEQGRHNFCWPWFTLVVEITILFCTPFDTFICFNKLLKMTLFIFSRLYRADHNCTWTLWRKSLQLMLNKLFSITILKSCQIKSVFLCLLLFCFDSIKRDIYIGVLIWGLVVAPLFTNSPHTNRLTCSEQKNIGL